MNEVSVMSDKNLLITFHLINKFKRMKYLKND